MPKENLAQKLTMTLPGIPAKRGRPCSGKALSNKERQERYRQKHRSVETGERMAATITRLAEQFDMSESEVTRELIRFALCNKKWSETGFPVKS